MPIHYCNSQHQQQLILNFEDKYLFFWYFELSSCYDFPHQILNWRSTAIFYITIFPSVLIKKV